MTRIKDILLARALNPDGKSLSIPGKDYYASGLARKIESGLPVTLEEGSCEYFVSLDSILWSSYPICLIRKNDTNN